MILRISGGASMMGRGISGLGASISTIFRQNWGGYTLSKSHACIYMLDSVIANC